MNLHVIAPRRKEDIWRKKRATFTLPPMALAILAALTPAGINIKVTDELVDDIDFDYPADLVALSVNTADAFHSYEVADRFRRAGARIVMGGIHPSVMPDEALLHADSVVIGEAENKWEGVIDDFINNRLKEKYRSDDKPAPETIPRPRWDLLNTKKYYLPRTIQASRGCPYGCSFCSSTQFFGVKFRLRPVEKVVEEVREYPGKMLVFVDDNIVCKPDYSRELFSALRGLGKMWVAQSSIDIAKDATLLRLASESGCAGLLIGFESITYGNRTDIKKLRTAREYEEAISVIRSYGIGVNGSFVFGFDADDLDTFHSTVDFVLRNRLEVSNYCKLTPFPGTRLFRKMDEEGRLLHRDWSKYDRYNIVYQPKNFSIDDFKRYTDDAYRKTYSISSIIRRTPGVVKNIPYYYALNLSYRFGARALRNS
ncbi:radical SAM superfamily protein [bacterium BMS3Abin07]|nr:radical SAM superfamily protein [bacterium BMS3Abin07]GBE32451.1 radical SAM superfamily protein [bacterium BMS3Bbin05]HDO23142.1 B12-binding domain-containing radical SAM protein [Nitrospirota bacterium]HDZ88115.1 B12-binding domain-containing radical SAM protein [Nitrospirota bacterium]